MTDSTPSSAPSSVPGALPWPVDAPVLPIARVRPVLDRLASLARTHEQDLVARPGLAMTEEEVAADPPPALEQIADELGALDLRGRTVLTLQVEDRTDVGPYTLLGAATTYYPLYESPDDAVVLTLDEQGAPGAVYGIGEDLALRLAAPDLPAYLERFAEALAATLADLDARGEEDTSEKNLERTEAAEEALARHLFTAILGAEDEGDEDDGTGAVDEAGATGFEDPLVAGVTGLPTGTLAVADLRGAALDIRVDPMEVDVPGDPLDLRLAWREGGLVLTLHAS